MIQAKRKILYFAPTARRHYQSLAAASHAEARARIRIKYPIESDKETGYYYSLEQAEPERYERIIRRLERFYRRQFRSLGMGTIL